MDWTQNVQMSMIVGKMKKILVGGWTTNPSEKFARQIGHIQNIFGVKIKDMNETTTSSTNLIFSKVFTVKSHDGSMGLVYLPRWMVDFYGKCKDIYHTWTTMTSICNYQQEQEKEHKKTREEQQQQQQQFSNSIGNHTNHTNICADLASLSESEAFFCR